MYSGTKLKADIAGCYACKKELSEHQINETNLNLSDEVKAVRVYFKSFQNVSKFINYFN